MDPELDHELIARAKQGQQEALGELLDRHRSRLERVVRFRMDVRLLSRLDASDIVQESFLVAMSRFDYFLKHQKTCFFLWLRYLTLQKLNELRRRHIGTQARTMDREISIFSKPDRQATTAQIAAQLFKDQTSPSNAMLRDEARLLVENALGQMDPLDQEVLAMRHFEQLSNEEVAESLDLSSSAASKRFVRALQRLRAIMAQYETDGV